MRSALGLALLLCAGAAFEARATPSGNRWALSTCGSCPMGQQCVSGLCAPRFRVGASMDNAGGMTINGPAGGVPYGSFVTLVNNTFPAWSTSRVSCNTNFNVVSAGTFTTPQGTAALDGMDRNNNVIFLSGTNWGHLPNELALTTTTFFTSNREIFDGDMEFNNNVAWSTQINGNAYDLESVILHEAGHFLGLNHTTGSATAVMFPTVNLGSSKRNLTPVDENDVCAVYPGAAGGQGTSCTTPTTCTAGRVCEGPPGGSKICTQDCTGMGACPAGFTCQASDTGSACLPQIGVSDQCKFCQGGNDCSSGVCLLFFTTGVTFCSLSCTDSAQCGSGYTCQLPEGICVPTALTCTNQCTTATDCATGYTCTGGTCTPRGDTGDPCTVSGFCKPCNVCVRESAQNSTSFCRVCCAGSGMGGFCNSCTNATCGMNGTCAALMAGSSSVCVPGSQFPGTCQPCANGQCAEGLACVAGRCRSACNPAAPGTCQACFNNGAGGGSCACADEVAAAGEPCGIIGMTLSACGAGLACVGSTNAICRSRCDVNIPNSCPMGATCQMVSGLGVCLPGSEGSVCAACTNTNACNGTATCYLGRCYDQCNVNLPNTCASCVQSQANGGGICACPDQISGPDGPCGTMPDVHSCQSGTKCIQGSCRSRCDPMVPACPQGTTCRDIGTGVFYCQDEIATGGGGGGGATGGGGSRGGGSGGATGGGGGTGGGTTDLGCGCGASGGPLGALVLGVVALMRRRRASRP